MTQASRIRARQRLGKYRIETRLAQGGFADVFRAYDTIEGIRVALKVPQPELLSPSLLEDFKKEVRLTARLDHPHILKIKNASYLGEHFVIVYHLGDGALSDRLTRRISFETAFDFGEQILDALAHAHAHRLVHCDVKPDNLIVFQGKHLRLTDFGLAKVSMRTVHASGSGTLGYMAPEQAMGRPSLRSDVFSAGLILYRMFAGVLHEWPFEWPPPGAARARLKLHPDLFDLLRRSLEIDPRKRFRDAGQMYDALVGMRARALRFARAKSRARVTKSSRTDWRAARLRQFKRNYQSALEARLACRKCDGPVSATMVACPWCSAPRKILREDTPYPARCPRCRRGSKLDWCYCPWCYGASIGPLSDREYGDKRYVERCANKKCSRRQLMPFMRYCPWCRTKVKKPTVVAGVKETCPKCHWMVLGDYWKSCPWCAHSLVHGAKRR